MTSAQNLEEIQMSLSNFGEQAHTLRICLKEPSVLISSFIFCHRSDCHSGCFDDKWWHRAPRHLCSIRTTVTVSALIKLLNRGGHFKPPCHSVGRFRLKNDDLSLRNSSHARRAPAWTPRLPHSARGEPLRLNNVLFSLSTRVWWRASGYISNPFDSTHCIFMHFKLHERKKWKHVSYARKIKKPSIWLRGLLRRSEKMPHILYLHSFTSTLL